MVDQCLNLKVEPCPPSIHTNLKGICDRRFDTRVGWRLVKSCNLVRCLRLVVLQKLSAFTLVLPYLGIFGKVSFLLIHGLYLIILFTVFELMARLKLSGGLR
jgi:hypothetical protein